jgi:inorganic triphosphatase YgiF
VSAPKATLERELKLVVWPEFDLPDLGRAVKDGRARAPVRRRLEAVYYDTEDLRLLRQGITLRRRRGDAEGPQWTLKLPARGPGLSRTELSLPARGPLPRRLSDLALGWALGADLGPVARMVTERTSTVLADGRGAAVASIDDDDVMVERAGHVVARFRELEIELAADAPGKLLGSLAKRLQAAGAQPAPQVPKLQRALGADAQAPPPLSPSGDELSDRLVSLLADGVVARHATVMLGDTTALRDMRDGARALAVTLRAHAPVLADKVVLPVTRELDWLAAQLHGRLVLEDLRAELRVRSLAAAAAAATERADARVTRVLRSARYRRLLADAASLACAPPIARRMRGRPLAKLRRRCADAAMASAPVDLRDAVERLACVLPGDDPARAGAEDLAAMLGEAADHLAAVRALRRLRVADTGWARGVLAGRHAQQADELVAKAAARWAEIG